MIQILHFYSEAPGGPETAATNRPAGQPRPNGPPQGPLAVSGPTRTAAGCSGWTTVIWCAHQGTFGAQMVPRARRWRARQACPQVLLRLGSPRRMHRQATPRRKSASASTAEAAASFSARSAHRDARGAVWMRAGRCAQPAPSRTRLPIWEPYRLGGWGGWRLLGQVSNFRVSV